MVRPRRASTLLTLSAIALLSGCTGGPTPGPSSPSPEVTRSSEPTASPTAATTPSPSPSSTTVTVTSIPSCEQILTVQQVVATVGEDRMTFSGEFDAIPSSYLPGPVAQSTYEKAITAHTCGWGIPESDGLVYVTVALVESAAAEPLIGALTNSTEYTRATLNEMTAFSKAITTGIGTNLGYAFTGNVWVIVEGTIVSEGTALALAAQAASSVVALR